MSRVGNEPITLPEKVTTSEDGGVVTVEGPKGKLSLTLPKGIGYELEDGVLKVTRPSDSKEHKTFHGTARSLLNGMVIGVSEGFVKKLEIQGVGLRAALKGSILDLSLGKSHPINHPVPEGIKVTVDDSTKITVEGIDKQLVGQFAADVRAYYPPEPYKGKGIRYSDEHVRRKAGKSVQG